MCPFDCTGGLVSGKVGIPQTGLTTPVEFFGGVFVLSFAILFSDNIGAFVIEISQIFFPYVSHTCLYFRLCLKLKGAFARPNLVSVGKKV